MKAVLFGGLILSACALTGFPARAADGPSSQTPKGTICYSNTLVVAGETNRLINCEGLGQFASVAELYAHGYRVVSSGFLPDRRPGSPPLTSTIYMIVEQERK